MPSAVRAAATRRMQDSHEGSIRAMATTTTSHQYTFTEKKRIRKSFAKRASVLGVPFLLETQLASYRAFLQADTAPDAPKLSTASNPVFCLNRVAISFAGSVKLAATATLVAADLAPAAAVAAAPV